METASQKLVKKAIQEGTMPLPRLQLAIQITDEAGNKKGVKGTGPHEVKFILDKIIKGRDYQTGKERYEVEYIFEEDGQKKRYSVPVKDKEGKLHYFIQRMAEVELGETIVLEYKKKPGSFEGFIEVRRMEEIPEVPEEPEGMEAEPQQTEEVSGEEISF